MKRSEVNSYRINLPQTSLRFREDSKSNLEIFDRIRKKWLKLTPEELVRQSFANWLIESYGFPESLMANEIQICVNDTRKRCDTVLFRPDGQPLVIVEYKSPDVQVTQSVFDQIVRYNMELKARYLIVSNGLNHYCCKIDYSDGTYHFIPRIPHYEDIV